MSTNYYDSHSKSSCPTGGLDWKTLVVIKEILSLVSKESGLNKAMFWGLELRPVNKSNIIQRNSRMTELEIEELESNLSKNDSYKEKAWSADNTGSNLPEEETRDILILLEPDEEIDNFEEEEVATIK